jgi:hypothetical protein
MSKRGNPMNVKKCSCDKCGAEANSIQDTTHRRCPGEDKKDPRPKNDKLPSNLRGKWM